MIELPSTPAPNGVTLSLLDFGLTLRPATGGAIQRIGRAGSRFRAELTFPPMKATTARQFISRLVKAKRVGGLRVEFPLTDISQGSPGSPVVNGAGQSGTTINLRSMTPGYVFLEGYWLSIVDASGQAYLHSVQAEATVNGTGFVSVVIEPPLRYPYADGAQVLVATPVIEGFIDGGEWSWDINTARHYGLSVVIEEAG